MNSLDYAKDAGNWSGSPLMNGNVGDDSDEQKAYVTHMKKAGLIETQREDGCTFIYFTDKGKAFALENGVTIH